MVCAQCRDCVFDNPNIPSDAHEIHITVENATVGEFSAMCGLLGHKPVLIAMQDAAGETFHHLMSSYTVRGTEEAARNVAERHAGLFREKGFVVTRIKIETTLRNTICFDRKDGQYYEAHIAIKVPNIEERRDTVSNVTGVDARLRLSNNPAKSIPFYQIYFVTMRIGDFWTPQQFETLVHQCTEGLSAYYEIGKVRMEFAWHDSNIDQDKEWK